MYEVKLYPSKCPSEGSWVHKHPDGTKYHISDAQYNSHKQHECMEIVEHYHMFTQSKKKCPHCKSIVIKRKKVVLNW